MLNFQVSRRQALKLGALALATLSLPLKGKAFAAESDGPFQLPSLPYPVDALQPVISAQTMRLHHGKHHQAYVNKLNAALEGQPNYAAWSLEKLVSNVDSLPESIRKAVRNQGGGHLNHSMFWESMLPVEEAQATHPSSALSQAITRDFGNLDNLKEKFIKAGSDLFGSGWVWLVKDTKSGQLKVVTTANQDSPVMLNDSLPLLGNDVWEHAYYLDYQNRRAGYLKAWWDVVNWNKVSERFA